MTVTLQLAAVLVLAAPAAAFAQTAPLTVHGRVFAAHDRAVLPRTRVMTVADGDTGPPAYTNDRGEFSVAAPSSPTFTLTVVKAGYAAMQVPLKREDLAAADARELAIALTLSAAVNGRIVDATGETLVGQRVYADRIDPDASTPQGLLKFATTADDRGEYRLGGLPPGRYSVTATGAEDPGAVVRLLLRPGDDLSGIDFTAQPPPESAFGSSPQPPETPERATIRGRVLSETGRPLARAIVYFSGPMPSRQFVTDARGRFAFTGLVPGDYEVRASRGDFLPSRLREPGGSESDARIAVSSRARVDDVSLVLSRGLAVTGTIVDRGGEPVQGVSVQALRLSASGGRRRAVVAGALVGGIRQTDDRGRYRVLGLQPGTYVIVALADATSLERGVAETQTVPIYFPGSASIVDATTVTIAATEVEGIDFSLADVPAGRVTGVALDSTGSPLDGEVTLAVSHRSGSIVPTPRRAPIGADGAFAFVHVAPGEYVVQALRSLRPSDAQRDPADFYETIESAVQYVTVGAADAEPVGLRTARGATMEGRVIVDSEAPDDPAQRMQIEAYPVDPDLASVPLVGLGGMARVADGRFRLSALTGPQRVAVSGMPDGWYLKTVTVNGSDVTDQAIDFGIGGGSTVSAEAVIAVSGGSIAGRVTTERRRSLAGALAVVFPEDREKWFERSRFVTAVSVGRDRSFRAASLPPGDYYVAVTAAPDGPAEATTAEALERLLPRATRVTLNDGEARNVEVRLP